MVKGVVTVQTTIAPFCFAISAITGAAPVPVPPPRPAAMNSKSTPRRRFVRSCLDSSAAAAPSSGNPPVPNPLVIVFPISIFL